MASQPFWQTNKRRPVASAAKSDAPIILTTPDQRIADSNNVRDAGYQNSLERSREEARIWVKQIAQKCRESGDLFKTERPPQEDGFIGVFIEVSRWQADWRPQSECRQGQRSPFAGRVGYQRPLDTVKIGEGTTFSVYRRYDNGSMLGRKPKLVVMKDSKIKFERDGTTTAKAILSGLLTEIRILSQVSLRTHKNIVTLLDIRWDHPDLHRESLGPTLDLEHAD